MSDGRGSVRADKVGFIVDAADYFSAFVDAVRRARKSVLIVGWDIDSRLELLRDDAEHEHPVGLAAFLGDVLDRRPDLEVRVLCWDYSVIYTLEREAFQRLRLGWATHDRLRFEFDDDHPVGGSHHQKIVVVDDRVAFVGGIDLGRRRWDTSRHLPDDERRTTPGGDRYPPHHDFQAVVAGDAAAALGDVVRRRWRRATGEELSRVEIASDPWPTAVSAAIEDVDVGIVLTEPEHAGRPEIRDTERSLVDAIARARRHIMIENQYLTARVIADALRRALDEQPELTVLAVTARENSGWLEKAAMGTLRSRFVARLDEHLRSGRFAVYWPTVGEGPPPNVHSKVMVVDDELACVGSANLSNRSMGLDTECGLVIDADGRDDVKAALGALRLRLLAEHLDVTPDRLADAIDAEGDPIAAVEALRGDGRTLVPLEAGRSQLAGVLGPVVELADPARAPSFEEMIRDVVE